MPPIDSSPAETQATETGVVIADLLRPQIDPYEALDRLRRVQSVTDAALANLIVDDLLDELLVRVSDALDSDTSAILLLDEERSELVARAARGIEEEVEQGVRIPLGKGFAGKIADLREPVVLDEVDHSNVLNPILREKGICSLLGVPLIVQGKLIGVLHVGTLTPRLFRSADIELLQLVADRVALAIHVGLYERERLVTASLQRAFLPEALPEIRGVQFSACYVPASGSGVGGDWYDAFALPDGTVSLIVGDVVGRGPRAASVMGRLRNTVRGYAVAGYSPAALVDALSTCIELLEPDEMATMLYAVLDPDRGQLTIVNAGHLAPLLVPPDSEAIFLETPRRPPLGTRYSHSASAHTVSVARGTTVLLYTDGLVERRGIPLDERLETLRSAAAGVGAFEELPGSLLACLADDPTDDVALLAVNLRSDMPVRYVITVPAHSDELRHVRSKLRAYLAEFDVSPGLEHDVLVAIGEACGNAVEHAYGAEAGNVTVTLTLGGGELTASVKDRGRWRKIRRTGRGRGLPIMHNLASSVDVRRTQNGTEIRLSWKVGNATGDR